MPLYEYRCGACSGVFEAYKRLSDEKKEETCPACGGSAQRLGISLVSAKAVDGGGKSGASSCGGAGRRQPFG